MKRVCSDRRLSDCTVRGAAARSLSVLLAHLSCLFGFIIIPPVTTLSFGALCCKEKEFLFFFLTSKRVQKGRKTSFRNILDTFVGGRESWRERERGKERVVGRES